MTDTTVKYFHSGMTGAPVLSGTPGGLIDVLDACLVNGFAVSSVYSLVVVDNVATATCMHSAIPGSVVLVSGAAPSGLNGEKKVLSVGPGDVLTFAAPGIANQTASGSISLKLAGAGWSKAHSGFNLAAYRSNDVAATGCCLRVDDNDGRSARCIGYETMTGIDVGSGPFPSTAQINGGVWWTKSANADAAARSWVVVADSRCFYLISRYLPAAYPGGEVVMFGDLVPVFSGDAWSCALSGMGYSRWSVVPGIADDYPTMSQTAVQLYLARSHVGIGGGILGKKGYSLPLHTATVAFASGSGPVKYPNAPDNGLYLSAHFVAESLDSSLRGISPGLYCSPQNLPDNWVETPYAMTGVAMLPGRTVMVEPYGGGGGVFSGYAFFDTTGPWR